MADKIKLGAAFLLVVAGIAAFYALHESPPAVKVAVVLLGVLLAAGVAFTSESGKRLFTFAKEAKTEAGRVVWPTRKETVQMTGVVIAFAIIMALFLWAVDSSLMVVVDKLMGRS